MRVFLSSCLGKGRRHATEIKEGRTPSKAFGAWFRTKLVPFVWIDRRAISYLAAWVLWPILPILSESQTYLLKLIRALRSSGLQPNMFRHQTERLY